MMSLSRRILSSASWRLRRCTAVYCAIPLEAVLNRAEYLAHAACLPTDCQVGLAYAGRGEQASETDVPVAECASTSRRSK